MRYKSENFRSQESRVFLAIPKTLQVEFRDSPSVRAFMTFQVVLIDVLMPSKNVFFVSEKENPQSRQKSIFLQPFEVVLYSQSNRTFSDMQLGQLQANKIIIYSLLITVGVDYFMFSILICL